MSLGCCMFCFLFYFASASQHSLVCLMSHCQVHEVAWQQEGSTCVIHRAAASSFANCMRLPGKGFSWPCLSQLRGLLPRKGKKTRERLAELWGVFGVFRVQMKESIQRARETPGRRLRISFLATYHRATWSGRVPLCRHIGWLLG